MKRSRTVFIATTLLLLLISVLTTDRFAYSQDQVLVGPIVAAVPVSGSWIIFQDIGVNRMWRLEDAEGIYVNWLYSPRSWSPDGCKLLLGGATNWNILSISDLNLQQLPIVTYVGALWSASTAAVTVTEHSDATNIYSVNVEDQTKQPILSFNAPGGAIEWLSDTELLYVQDGFWRVWDTTSEESRAFGTEQFPRYGSPQQWDIYPYASVRSPNHEILARYYNIQATLEPIDALYPEDFVIPEDLPQTPGFDLYFVNEGISRHVDVHGEFLQSLQWSASSRKIVVGTYSAHPPETTEFSGIYVCDVQSAALEKVGDFVTYRDIEYGPSVPSWSPDEEWLAIPTATDWILYHLADGEITELDEQFNQSPYMEISWSPVMSYSGTQCSI
jgi:hypothetical protein